VLGRFGQQEVGVGVAGDDGVDGRGQGLDVDLE
jgi:hypothetical protein